MCCYAVDHEKKEFYVELLIVEYPEEKRDGHGERGPLDVSTLWVPTYQMGAPQARQRRREQADARERARERAELARIEREYAAGVGMYSELGSQRREARREMRGMRMDEH